MKDVPVYSDIELLLDKIDQESKEGKALGGGAGRRKKGEGGGGY